MAFAVTKVHTVAYVALTRLLYQGLPGSNTRSSYDNNKPEETSTDCFVFITNLILLAHNYYPNTLQSL